MGVLKTMIKKTKRAWANFLPQRRMPLGVRRILSGFPGFFGFIGFNAFLAFPNHNPWYFFLFGCFTIFSEFRYWKDELKYLGLSGLLGLIIPALWALGLFKV